MYIAFIDENTHTYVHTKQTTRVAILLHSKCIFLLDFNLDLHIFLNRTHNITCTKCLNHQVGRMEDWLGIKFPSTDDL